jgi:hypothetical protein
MDAPCAVGVKNEKLKVGMELGGFIVHKATEGRLILRGSRAFAVKAILSGMFLIALGVFGWMGFLSNNGHVNPKLAMAPVGGFFCIVTGLLRLGETLEFDASSRTLMVFQFLGHRILRPGSLSRVRLAAQQATRKRPETLVLNLTGAHCRSVLVGRVRSSSRAAANLAIAAGHIAARHPQR